MSVTRETDTDLTRLHPVEVPVLGLSGHVLPSHPHRTQTPQIQKLPWPLVGAGTWSSRENRHPAQGPHPRGQPGSPRTPTGTPLPATTVRLGAAQLAPGLDALNTLRAGTAKARPVRASPGEASGRPGGDQGSSESENGEWPTARGLSPEGRPRCHLSCSQAHAQLLPLGSWHVLEEKGRPWPPGLGWSQSKQAPARPPALALSWEFEVRNQGGPQGLCLPHLKSPPAQPAWLRG